MSRSGQRSILQMAIGAFALILTACDASDGAGTAPGELRETVEGPALELRSERAKRPGANDSTTFDYVRYYAQTDGETPIACLAFSKGLDAKADYTPYIVVEPEKPIALTVDGSDLCVGGLGFGEETRLTLKQGLPGAGRDTELAIDQAVSISFGDRPTHVGFKGDGVILPRVQADGVAFETVNVDALKVKLQRVTDRALAFKTITSGFSAGRGEYQWLDQNENPDDVAEDVWEGELDVVNSPNVSVTTVFSLASAVERLQPGAYYIQVEEITENALDERRPARAGRWLIVTDLALTAYHGVDQMMVRARSISTAKIARDVRLELIARNNEVLSSRRTDTRGLAYFEAPLLRGDGPLASRMLLAYDENGDFAVLDLDRPAVDLSHASIDGRAPPKAIDGWIYTDRGVYRPGERIEITALLRDAMAMAVSDRAGELAILGPNGLETASWRFDRAPEAGGVSYTYDLPKSAARGQWRLVTRVDGVGEVAAATISVEDFVPQRIELSLDSDIETPLLADQSRPVTADVRFLYGAPGAGLTIESRARVETDPNPYPDLQAYHFGRHDEAFREREIDMKDVVADGSGRAILNVDPRAAAITSSQPLRLRLAVSAIEPGGRAVSDDLRVKYRPREDYLGIRPDFDGAASEGEKAAFDLVSVGAKAGRLREAEAEWSLVRIDWDYDWYRADGGDWKWRRSRNLVDIDAGVAQLGLDGPTQIVTRTLDWGDYELTVTDRQTGAQASYGFWAGWGSGPQEGGEAPDRIRISQPEGLVQVGGKAVFTILPPYDGEAEIVVANEHIIEQRTVSVRSQGERIELPVTEEWGAGAYIMVSVYTPRDPVARPRPRRAVGVAYAATDVSRRKYEVSIDGPELVTPRQNITLQITADGGPRGENVFATIAAVDEGILLLTKHKSPDPSDWFFARRQLGVTLKDDYGRLLDPNQGAAAIPRSGGDQIGGAGLTVVPTKSVALFKGPIALGRDGSAEVELNLPDFNGELRLMTVVWSDSGLGAASRPLTVRDEAPTELILPRFLAPGDSAIATATIDNVAGANGVYAIDIEGRQGLGVETDSLRAVLDQGERDDLSVDINANSEAVTSFGLNVSGPGGFSVSRDYDIQVRSAFLPEARIRRFELAPGESFRPDEAMFANLAPGSVEALVSASPIPLDAGALYDSLDRYPYGCTEQTVSRAMPLLFAEGLARLAGRDADGEIRGRVQDAVTTLLNRQSADGAIGLWRLGDRQASPWIGAYAVDFLSRAKARGYEVPQNALDRAYAALGNIAEQKNLWGVGYDFDVYTEGDNADSMQRLKDRSSAYAAYVLARAGKIEISRLRYLHDERLGETESPLARAHIGAGLAMLGDRSRARSAFEAAKEVRGYFNEGDYYQTARRDLAGVLSLAAEARFRDVSQELTEDVTRQLPDPHTLTTQEKAFLLLAANALGGGQDGTDLDVRGQVVQLSEGRSYMFTDSDIVDERPLFTNQGEDTAYVSMLVHGAPTSPPPIASEGLSLSKAIAHTDGRPANLSAIQQGDRLVVTLSVRAQSSRLHPVILADLLPAGFEIEAVLTNATSGPYPTAQELDEPRLAEARDDRFVAALDLRNRQAQKLAYVVRAVTPGDFAAPGAVAEDMYRPDIFARTASQRAVIAPSGN